MTVKDPLIESVTPKTKWVVVLRPFDGSGIRYERGQVVDSTGWIHTTTLINRRYVAPLPFAKRLYSVLASRTVPADLLPAIFF